MPDEKKLFAKLGSWVYGSMVHTTHVVGRELEADVAAVMLYNLGGHPYQSHVQVLAHGLKRTEDMLCQQWVNDPQGLFVQVRRFGRNLTIFTIHGLADQIHQQGGDDPDRLRVHVLPSVRQHGQPSRQAASRDEQAQTPHAAREVMEDDSEPDLNFFERLEDICPVRQGLCMNVNVYDDVWGTLALLYADADRTFSERETQCLEHIKPAVSHMLRSSCARQGLLTAGSKPAGTPATSQQQLTLQEILSRLTRAERQVLGYLRLSATEKEISQQIYRSPHTVHVHVKNIYRKLEVRSRGELLQLFGDTLKD